MAVFKTRAEKVAKAQQKREDRLGNLQHKYNLYALDDDDLAIVERIYTDLAGLGLMKAGITLQSKAEETAKIGYSSAQVEQNWLIINLLSRLNENVEELIEMQKDK